MSTADGSPPTTDVEPFDEVWKHARSKAAAIRGYSPIRFPAPDLRGTELNDFVAQMRAAIRTNLGNRAPGHDGGADAMTDAPKTLAEGRAT